MRRIERRVFQQARGQVRIGDEILAEGDGIGLAGIDQGLGHVAGQALVGNVHATERRFQRGAQTRRGLRFAGEDEGDFALAQFAGDIAEGGERVAVAHGVGVAARREVHADAASAPDADRGVGDFQQQAGPVFDTAAVAVGAPVRAVLEKLIQQIAVRAMQFDAVEPRRLGVDRALAVSLDDGGDFFGFQRARHDIITLGPQQADMPFRRQGARGNR